ncbi:MAG: hypothetical protein WC458_04170 [Patescibacteria group bacterium]|jgi:uncharacterized membrane protein
MNEEKKEENKKSKLMPVLDILEESVKVWWKNLKKIVGVYLWGLLFALVSLVVSLLGAVLIAWLGDGAALILKIGASVIVAAGVVASIYFSIRAYMSVFLLVKKDYQGKELDIFKETKKLFWPYFGLTLLTTIFILLWSLLLIIPGIIYSIFYSLACYAFFFEEKRGMAAIRRSIQLVKGYWWPVFGRFLVICLATWIFMAIVSLPLSFVSEDSIFSSLWAGLIQIISFLIGPVVLLFNYRIYRDLVKIKK